MPTCRNPECGKEIQEGKNYCDENCLRRHMELKKSKRQKPNNIAKLSRTNSEWVGQDRARNTMNTMLKICIEMCPVEKETLIAHMRYRTGLHWRKIEEDYFRTLWKINAVAIDSNNLVTVTELGKTLFERHASHPP